MDSSINKFEELNVVDISPPFLKFVPIELSTYSPRNRSSPTAADPGSSRPISTADPAAISAAAAPDVLPDPRQLVQVRACQVDDRFQGCIQEFGLSRPSQWRR